MLDRLKSQQYARFAPRRRQKLNKLPQWEKWFLIFSIIAGVVLGIILIKGIYFPHLQYLSPQNIAKHYETPKLSSSPSPTPSPRPLTFAEMNALYGPCIYLPTLMYHHIEDSKVAEDKKQTSINVDTAIFREQMQYLKDKGYNTLGMDNLAAFFDSGAGIPAKSVLLTFDDGYEDFYTDAFPILSSLGFRATMFTITGLVNNPDYLTWDQIMSMSGQILFASHTWSHKSFPSANTQTQENEISLADTQLSEKGLNSPKVLAYPYGGYTDFAGNYIKGLGYVAAFGTKPGSVLCKKQRFDLPRVRIGNVQLSAYGF